MEIFAPPFISTFCSISNGNILPFFACREKTKNPDFAWKSGFYCLLLFFKVVPPGIEPGTQGFSVLCSTNWAMAPLSIISWMRCKGRSIFSIIQTFWGEKWILFFFEKISLIILQIPQKLLPLQRNQEIKIARSECSAVGSALRSGRRGRAFESPHSDRSHPNNLTRDC